MAKKNLTPLVIKAQAGDAAALNELMNQCYETLFYYAYNTVKNEDLAGDITQESCLEIMQTIGNLRNPDAFHTWAGRIVAHQCTRHFRQTRDEVPLMEDREGETILDRLPDERRGSLPEQVQEDKEFRQIMWQMLDALPPEQRQALLLYYFENMSVGEIAQIQDRSPGTVKSRLNYGRKAVIAQVEAYEKKTGVRLHSLAPLPLLLYFLFRENLVQVVENGAATLEAVRKTVSGAAAGTSAGAATAAGAGISLKVIAGIAAAVIAAGALVAGIALGADGGLLGGGTDDGGKATAKNHVHDYSAEYISLDDGHQAVCRCGDRAEKEPHTYQDKQCTLCGSMQSSEGLEFQVYQSYCVLSGIGTCTDTVVVIPAYHQGLPVRTIGEAAFVRCKQITQVYIPETVKTICQWAFWECSGLKTVHFSEGLQTIEQLAFIWCTSLEEVVFPNSLTSLGHSVFNECSALRYVKLPEALDQIQRGTFSNCSSLTTIEIPATVTTIGNKTFWHCTSLSQIRYGGTMAQWQAVDKQFEVTSRMEITSWDSDTGAYQVYCTDGQLG